MGPESLYCSKWRKNPKSHCGLDLVPTLPIIELVRDIFIYYNVFQFHVPRSITFLVILQKHTHGAHIHTQTDELRL